MSPPNDAKPDTLRVMSFNIRYNNLGDGANAWPLRRAFVVETILAAAPDIAGFQEVQPGQLDDLKKGLPKYDYYGVGRDDGKDKGEHVPLFYLRDRFERLAAETIWLSETPEKPSRGWDAAIQRIATIVQLRDKQTNRKLWVACTHFDHVGQQARRRSARLLVQVLRDRAGDEPVIALGDFNARPGSLPIKRLTRKADDGEAWSLHDTRELAKKPLGPDSTWSGFEKIAPGARIDFIFVNDPWRVERFEILEAQREGRFASDHLPVVVDIMLRDGTP